MPRTITSGPVLAACLEDTKNVTQDIEQEAEAGACGSRTHPIDRPVTMSAQRTARLATASN